MKKNKSTRRIKLQYLQHAIPIVAFFNENGEYEIKPSKSCSCGDKVWILEDGDTFTEAEIY